MIVDRVTPTQLYAYMDPNARTAAIESLSWRERRYEILDLQFHRQGRRLEEMTYQAVFEQADDGSVFVYVPDLPGCTSSGATLDEAREHVREAIALWLAVARENGKDAPAPSTIASAPIVVDAA